MDKNNYEYYISDFKNYLNVVKNLSDIYIDKMIGTVNQFLNFINSYKFEDKFKSEKEITLNEIRTITNLDIYSYVFYLSENNYTQSSRNVKLEHLRTFFKYLFKIMHNIFKQPFDIVRTEKRESLQLPNYLSLKEAQKMIKLYNDSQKANEIRNSAIISLCLNSGLRVSEISALNISEIQFNNNTFIIHGKGKKERTGYMNEKTKKDLLKYLEIRKEITPKKSCDKDALFLSNKRARINVKTIRSAVKAAYAKADINSKNYSVHTLRHTCATLLYKSGTDIKVIQEILGHTQSNVTKIYTHLHDQEVMDNMLKHPLAQFKMQDAYEYC